MTAFYTETFEAADTALDVIEQCLTSSDWSSERGEGSTLHCAAPTRWGECGGMFAWRDNPNAVHFTLSAELRAPGVRQLEIVRLLSLVNERLWLCHFEYWSHEGVVMFRHTLPMLDRPGPEPGEIVALITAATEAVDRFLPAFNFVVWAGKSAEDAVEASLFDTCGEA